MRQERAQAHGSDRERASSLPKDRKRASPRAGSLPNPKTTSGFGDLGQSLANKGILTPRNLNRKRNRLLPNTA